MSAGGPAELVRVEHLSVRFPVRGGLLGRRAGWVQAVTDVSFGIRERETLGLVGESGCGKSTIGRALLMLVRPSGGSVRFGGVEITKLPARELRRARRAMQMVFQDPYSSLDPRQRVGDAIREALEIHRLAAGRAAGARVREVLEAVGLGADAMARLPHEFSGGQRQRVAIARALAVSPSFLVCDEPISALDVSIQAQVINLLEDLQERFGLTYLFIAHDLAVVRHISSRVAVMYLGRIVELGDRDGLYRRPLHPYTQALLSAVPRPDPIVERRRERVVLRGEIPSAARPPTGCRFHTRCPHARDRCRLEDPPLVEVGPGRRVACHFWDEIEERRRT